MITTLPTNERRYDVRRDGRLIGFICLVTVRGREAWRFISNRRDVAQRLPPVASEHETPEAALAALVAALD